MTDAPKTFVSVDRARLKEDRASGRQQAVIRVQQGSLTRFTTDAEILGPARVRYHLHPPAGVPNVWIETDADVRIADEASSVEPFPVPPVPLRPMPKSRPVLSRLLQTNLLELAIRKIEADLLHQPRRVDLLRRLGDLQRQTGDHARALATYQSLTAIDPSDAVANRLIAILSGHVAPVPPWPEPFALERDFLAAEQLETLLAFTARQEQGFAPTPVAKDTYNVNARWSTNVWDVGPIAEWLLPLIHARVHRTLAQFDLPEEPLELRDCKITHYGDGGFFGPHVDRGPGHMDRVLGFILYFYFPPKRFTGGGLAIYDRDLRTGTAATSCTTIIPEQNQLVILASDCWHEVLPVRCPADQWDAGRFTFNGWICRKS